MFSAAEGSVMVGGAWLDVRVGGYVRII
jgi:hypothetical protein